MIGSNVSTVGGIDKGFVQATKWKCDCIQIYTLPSRRWSVEKNSKNVVNDFWLEWKKSNVRKVIAHIPFLVNLASIDKGLRSRARERLAFELESASNLGIANVVLHPGSTNGGKMDEGLNRIISGIDYAIEKTKRLKTRVLLEIMAGQGSVLGNKFEQHRYIINNIDNKSRIGVCFDTCHAFTAGYDIRGYEGMKKVLDEFDEVLGLDYLFVFHLNDSMHGLGTRKDKHTSIGYGYIGYQTFHYLVREKKFKDIPMILENPNRDRESSNDLALLFKLKDTDGKISEPESMIKDDAAQLSLFDSN